MTPEEAYKLLTKNEAEIVHLFVAGNSVDDIATQLHRTKRTVTTQKRAAMRKLDVNNDGDLIRNLTTIPTH